MRPSTMRRHLIVIALVVSHNASASQNMTIDDERGDEKTGTLPTYTPADQWSQGASCSSCSAKPDAQLVFGGTWHDALHIAGDPVPRIVSLQFNGSAIYAFFILANAIPNGTALTSLIFELDGSQIGSFMHTTTSGGDYLYNVPGYVNTSIPNGPHQLDIVASGASASIVLFDYAVYTADDQPTPVQRGSSRNTPVIVGPIVGGLLLVVAGVVSYLWLRRRKRRNEAGGGLEPYMVEAEQRQQSFSSVSCHAVVGTVPESTAEPEYSVSPRSSMIYSATFKNPRNLSNADRTTVSAKTRSADASALASGSTTETLHSTPNQATIKSNDDSGRLFLDLQQQVRDIQSELSSLSASSSSLSPVRNGSHYISGIQGNSDTTSEGRRMPRDSEPELLRRRIATLQTEIDRIKSRDVVEHRYGLTSDPPPGYSRDTHRDG